MDSPRSSAESAWFGTAPAAADLWGHRAALESALRTPSAEFLPGLSSSHSPTQPTGRASGLCGDPGGADSSRAGRPRAPRALGWSQL